MAFVACWPFGGSFDACVEGEMRRAKRAWMRYLGEGLRWSRSHAKLCVWRPCDRRCGSSYLQSLLVRPIASCRQVLYSGTAAGHAGV